MSQAPMKLSSSLILFRLHPAIESIQLCWLTVRVFSFRACFFEIQSCSVTLIDLKLPVELRMASNLQQFSCLYLLNSGIKMSPNTSACSLLFVIIIHILILESVLIAH